MLKLNPNPTFKHKVKIPLPGGSVAEVTFEFKHMTVSQMRAFNGDRKTNAEALMEILAGWSGVDQDFSKEAVETLCDVYPGAPAVILSAWGDELTKGRLGN